MSDWRKALLRALGFRATPQNLKFLDTWQRWEGGHTKNSARFNWLNTTHGEGRPINSVGVKAFRSFNEGIMNTAATLNNGRYGDILKALQTGDPYSAAPTAGLQVWVSGRPDGNPAYAQKVLGGKVSVTTPPPPDVARGRPRLAKPPKNVSLQDEAWDRAMGLIFEDDPSMIEIMSGLGDMGPTTPIVPKRFSEQPPAVGVTRTGKTLVLPTAWKGTHTTDGMDWGNMTATDIMAPPGTPVGAPEAGTVIYYHPTGAQGGGSMLIRTDSGREYWLGHVDAPAVRPGTRVRRGQVVVHVSADHAAPHVHLDRRG